LSHDIEILFPIVKPLTLRIIIQQKTVILSNKNFKKKYKIGSELLYIDATLFHNPNREIRFKEDNNPVQQVWTFASSKIFTS